MNIPLKLLIIALTGLAAYYGRAAVARFEARSENSYAKNMASSISAAEQSYHSQWGMYSDNVEQIGFRANGIARPKIYFHLADIPIDIRASMLEDDIPYVEKDR